MTQTILNFKLDSTDEKLTPRSGVIILGEFLKGIGLEQLCNINLPKPLNHRGYNPFEYIFSLVLMLNGGGRVLEDIKEIKQDVALKQSLNIENIPTASAIIKWLKKVGLIGVYGLEKINKIFLNRYLKKINKKDLILDIDASVIESHKSTANYTYKKVPGYTPMIGHINNGYIINAEFRDGNIAPSDTNLEFIKKCIKQLPNNKKIKYIRADSASYQAKIFNHCEDNNIKFVISAPLDESIKYNIDNIPNDKWEKLSESEEIAEFIHTMNNTNNAFRVIVTKKTITPMLPHIEDYLTTEQKHAIEKTYYHCIATNDNNLTPQEIVKFYRQRGETSENKIKELKNGFNLDYLPTSNFISNALYFQIGVLAYNLFLLFKTILDKNLQHHTIKTIRYKIYNIAGKLITHSREIILKVNKQFLDLLQKIRYRAYEVSLE